VDEPDTDLPDLARAPVIEMALGVQFRRIYGRRPIELANLRERWRTEDLLVQEQRPLPPKSRLRSARPGPVRHRPCPADSGVVHQPVADRAGASATRPPHRQGSPERPYPRYPHATDPAAFVEDHDLAAPGVVQSEVTCLPTVRDALSLPGLRTALRGQPDACSTLMPARALCGQGVVRAGAISARIRRNQAGESCGDILG
jgi:hypothetical protein